MKIEAFRGGEKGAEGGEGSLVSKVELFDASNKAVYKKGGAIRKGELSDTAGGGAIDGGLDVGEVETGGGGVRGGAGEVEQVVEEGDGVGWGGVEVDVEGEELVGGDGLVVEFGQLEEGLDEGGLLFVGAVKVLQVG